MLILVQGNLKFLFFFSPFFYGLQLFNNALQLFLMKRGGQEIYVGPLGRHSCQLISYFEVCADARYHITMEIQLEYHFEVTCIIFILKLSDACLFVFIRLFLELRKLKMVTIRPLGCWK